jgi:lipoate-protein ligase B
VHLLEAATIGTLARFGVRGVRTDNPGVWVDEETKIAALGVHLRRSVTSYGVGLNVATDLRWFDRIVACGLEGKRTTSMEAEGVGMDGGGDESLARVAEVWADEFAKGLWGDERMVERIMDAGLLGDSS